MTEQVVTQLVIEGDTSGADQFSRAMDGAEQAASRVSGTLQNLGSSIVIGFTGVAVAFAGLRAGIDFVGSQNKQFVDIADNARLAGVSLKEYQETLYAAKSSGISDKNFDSGLEKIGADLTAAGRGVTEFGKLFEKNSISIRNSSGEVKTAKEGLVDIANLMKNAPTPQIEQGIAKIVGVTKDWIPFLRQGGQTIEEIKAKAQSVGAVVDDSIILKAKEFDKEWKMATAAWDLQFKSSLAGIMPLMIKLANLASTMLDNVGQFGNFVSRALTPTEDMGVGDLKKQTLELQDFRKQLETGELYDLRRKNKAGYLRLPEDSGVKEVDAEIARIDELIKKKSQVARININGGTTGNGSTQLPDTGADKDAVDRAIDSLRKHTERQLADTEAVGLGAGALARFRAEAAETSAKQANNGVITQKQAAEFKKLQQEAERAAGALAKAKVESSIEFGQKTAFLTPQDVQIAQQLKDIYGNDVPAALNSSYAAAIRLTAGVRDISDTARETTKSFVSDFRQSMQSGKNAWDSFASAGVNALNKIADKLMQMSIDALWSKAFGGSSSGNVFSSLFGSSGGGASIGTDGIGGFGPTAPPMFADGTDNAPGGWSIIGERGPERMYVPKGAQILPTGIPKPDNGGEGTFSFSLPISIDATGADAAGLARVEREIARLRVELPSTIVRTVTKAREQRQL